MDSERIAEPEDYLVDVYQLGVSAASMIMEQIRRHIRTCGKSRYQISKETGIDKAALCRIMQGGSCRAETADILLDYFGLEVRPKDRQKKK